MSQSAAVGGRFEIGELVHAGKTGEVYKAVDLETGNAVAVKRVHGAVFDSELARQRAERELTQLATLSSEGVARVLAQGVDSGLLWYAMEWAEGRPLSTLVEELGPLPPANATQLIQIIGKALGDAATVGVIHRDLAAKNVLVAQDGSVKLINFCVATPAGKIPGVPEFVAPEQVDGRPVDLRSNIYNVGAILYLLLTGKPPHTGDAQTVHAAHKNEAVQPPSQVGPGISGSVDQVVLRALEKSPGKRFMTLPQLLKALDDAVKGKGPAPAAQGPAPEVSDSAATTQPLGKSSSPAGAGKPGGKGKAPAPAKTLLGMPAIGGSKDKPAGKPETAEEGPKTEPMSAQPEPEAPAPEQKISGSIEEPAPNKTLLHGQPVDKASLKTTAPDSPKAKASLKDTTPDARMAGASLKATAPDAPMAGAAAGKEGEDAGQAPSSPGPAAGSSAQTPPPAAQTPPPAAQASSPAAQTPAPQTGAAAGKGAHEPGAMPALESPQQGAPAASGAGGPKAAVVPSAPKVSGKSTGKNKSLAGPSSTKSKKQKGKFRETLWFKKGDLDAAAAQAAAEKARQQGDSLAADKADSLPMDERYEDDGTVSSEDRQQHSLRTGNTEMMQAVSTDDVRRSMEADAGVTEQDLIADMQSGRQKLIIAVVVGLLVVIGVIAFLAT